MTEVRELGEEEKQQTSNQYTAFDNDGSSLESPNHHHMNPLPQENSLFLDRSTSQNEHLVGHTLTENSFLNAGLSRINNSYQGSILGCQSIS